MWVKYKGNGRRNSALFAAKTNKQTFPQIRTHATHHDTGKTAAPLRGHSGWKTEWRRPWRFGIPRTVPSGFHGTDDQQTIAFTPCELDNDLGSVFSWVLRKFLQRFL